jgi:hypothetical protein
VEAAAAQVATAEAAVDAAATAATGAALRSAQALLTAKIVVRAEKAVLRQAVDGVCALLGSGGA